MKAILIPFILLLVVPQESAPKPPEPTDVEGTIVCVGCTLAKDGADAQCTLHAKHAQGLLKDDGTLITLLDNARGHHIITNAKLRGKRVQAHGRVFPKAQYMEILRFKMKEGDKWVQWDYCKTCGFEEGDNGGTDLCEHCR